MKIIKQDNLSKSEKNVAIMLEEYGDFEDLVKFFRLSLGIQPQGEDFKDFDSVMSKIDYEKLNYAIGFVLTRYKFPKNWFTFFSNIFIFGVATKPDVFELRYDPNKFELHLVIKDRVSKQIIKEAIDKSKDIVKYLTKLPKVDDLSKLTIGEDYQKINKLQYNKNGMKVKTNEEVADEREYKDIARVANIKYEFKQYVKKVLKKQSIEERMIQTIGLHP